MGDAESSYVCGARMKWIARAAAAEAALPMRHVSERRTAVVRAIVALVTAALAASACSAGQSCVDPYGGPLRRRTNRMAGRSHVRHLSSALGPLITSRRSPLRRESVCERLLTGVLTLRHPVRIDLPGLPSGTRVWFHLYGG